MQLAGAGAHLFLVGRDAESLAEASRLATAARVDASQQILLRALDLAHPDACEAATEDCVAAWGGVDILINNAGTQGPIGPLVAVDPAAWQATFDVNLFAPMRLSRRLIPTMRERGRGKIVNVSGGGATGPRPDFSAYACAKTALVRLTETLAEELKPDRIDVNALAPGAMNTRMLDEVLAAGPAGSREYAAALKRSREGGTPPATAAEAAVWLASPASDGITGRLISAVWDNWKELAGHADELAKSDVYTLRRILPKDRGFSW